MARETIIERITEITEETYGLEVTLRHSYLLIEEMDHRCGDVITRTTIALTMEEARALREFLNEHLKGAD